MTAPTNERGSALLAATALVAGLLGILVLRIGPDSSSPAATTDRRTSMLRSATYQPPTSGPVVDPFRPPPAPWLSGNRGIEYATAPGTPVTAIGPGRVTFAGPVVGRRIVVVLHPDGLRSSYVGLALLEVHLGDRVAGGAVVGLAADRLHLGVRRGETYLDPASLWGRPVGGGRVVLVPNHPSSHPSSHRSGRHLGPT